MKKIISLILCAILVLSMAISAFAATDPTVGFNPAPNNPTRPDLNAPMNPAPAEVATVIIDTREEANPNTGAPVLFAPAVIAAVAAAAVIGKRK